MAIFEKTFTATSTEQINKIFTDSLPVYTSLVVGDSNNEYGTFKIIIKYSEELTIEKEFIKNGQAYSIITGDILYTYNGNTKFTIDSINITSPFNIDITFYSAFFDEESYPSHEILYRRDKTRQNFTPFKWEGSEEDSDSIIQNLTNLLYPVGSIYISTNQNPPIFGTWKQIEDTFLLAIGQQFKGLTQNEYETGNLGPKGGSAKTTLPSHKHTILEQKTKAIEQKHSHTPDMYTNSDYKYGQNSGWIGVVANNNCTAQQAETVASGIAQQGYVTTNSSSTPDKSFPFVSCSSDLINFTWDKYTNEVNTTHSHDLPDMITNSITGCDAPVVTVDENDISNMPPYLPVYMWRRMV